MATRAKQKPEQPQDAGRPANPGQKQKPVWSMQYRTGSGWVEVAVFEHAVNHGDSPFTTYSTAVKRRYRDGEQYKSSQSFRADDLLVLAHGLTAAYAWISRQEKK